MDHQNKHVKRTKASFFSQAVLDQARERDPWRDTHPPEELLVRYAYEQTNEADTRALVAHLLHCDDPRCAKIVSLCRADHMRELTEAARMGTTHTLTVRESNNGTGSEEQVCEGVGEYAGGRGDE